LRLGGNEVLSDFSVETAFESAVRGNPGDQNIETRGAFQNRSSAKLSVLGTKLTGNIRLISGEEQRLWQAGHSIERSFGPAHVREAYNGGTADATLRHEFALGYNDRLRAESASLVSYENRDISRSWKLGGGYRFFKNQLLHFDADLDARWLERREEPTEWLSSYGTGWRESALLMKPDSGQGIRGRRAHGLFKTSLLSLPVGVGLSFEGSSDFSETQALNTQDSRQLSFPFRFGNYQGSFSLERSFYRSLDYEGGAPIEQLDIGDDLGLYGESLSASGPLWTSLPFYSFYDDAQRERMAELRGKDGDFRFNSGRFRDAAGFNLRLPQRDGGLGLVVPQGLRGGTERILYQKLDTLQDLLRYSGGLSFQAINLFGAFGSKPLFSFYQSDEFAHSIDGIVSVPRGEELSWQMQAAQRLGFYGFSGAAMSVYNTLNIGSRGWSDSLSLEWTSPTKRSLLSLWYDAVMVRMGGSEHWSYFGELAEKEYEQLRKETLEITIEQYEDTRKFSLVIGHESIIRIFGQLNLSVFGRLTNSYDSNTEILSFIASIGTTLHVMF
jgi:hypothetical protein